MWAAFLSMLVSTQILGTPTPRLVPESTSPDGKTALYYVHDPAKQLNDGYEMFFGDVASQTPLSSNLIPLAAEDLTKPHAMEALDTSILLGGIASHFEAPRQHVRWDSGFSYHVVWSPDSTWVSIEGGAHKFWATRIYHHLHGDFQTIGLPGNDRFQKYFFDRQDVLASLCRDLGVSATIRKRSTNKNDPPRVCWLQDGELAINPYAYLFREDFFFVLDARTDPAAITGFCH
jgi:hypothetical protein